MRSIPPTMPMAPRAPIAMTAVQALLLARACELFARLRLGQFDQLTWLMNVRWVDTGTAHATEAREAVASLGTFVHGVAHRGASFGIGQQAQVGVTAQQMYEMEKVLDHRLSWDRLPAGAPRPWTVNFNEPLALSGTRLPQCTGEGVRERATDGWYARYVLTWEGATVETWDAVERAITAYVALLSGAMPDAVATVFEGHAAPELIERLRQELGAFVATPVHRDVAAETAALLPLRAAMTAHRLALATAPAPTVARPATPTPRR